MAPSAGTLAILAVSSFVTQVVGSVPVTIGLRSSWPAHNLLLEILETAAIDQPTCFFPLVDILTSPDEFPSPLAKLSPEAIHQASLEIAQKQGYLVDDSARRAFELALALHVSSPRLEAFYQYYEDRNLDRSPPPAGYLVEECASWVDWYGSRLCSSDDLRGVLSREGLEAGGNVTMTPKKSKLLPFDHVFPEPGITLFTPPRTAILYADVTSLNFRDLHEYLMASATKLPPKIQYVFRHVPPPKLTEGHPKREYLSGYGVGLDLKKMDYLALDDRRSSAADASSDLVDASTKEAPRVEIIRELLDKLPPPKNSDPLNFTTPLSKEEFQYLGVQAAQLIVSSSNPIETFMQLSEDFPRHATELARRVDIDGDMQFEMAKVSRMVPKGASMAWLNGKVIDSPDEFNPFNILNLLRAERSTIESLTALGLNPGQAIEVLTGRPVLESFSQGNVLDGIFDVSDREEGGDVIFWFNDLEKDGRYGGWPNTVEAITTPIYPGSFHNIAVNMYNVILAVDLSNRETLVWIFQHISNIINKNFPFHWGIVPLLDTPEAEKAARIFYYVHRHYGPKEAMDFVRTLIAAHPDGDTIDFLITNAFFNNLAINVLPLLQIELDQSVSHDYDTVLAGQEPHSIEQLEKARNWAKRVDVQSQKEQLGHVFFNGKHYPLDGKFLGQLQQTAGTQTSYLQAEVKAGRLLNTPELDMSVYFYDLPTTPKRRNRYLYPDETSPLRVYRLDSLFTGAGFKYPYKDLIYPAAAGDASEPVTVTVWIVGDIDHPSTIALVNEALLAQSQQKDFRLGFVHAPRALPLSDATHTPRQSTILQQLSGHFDSLSPEDIQDMLKNGDPSPVSPVDPLKVSHLSLHQVNPRDYLQFCMSGQLLAREVALKPGQMALIVNGRAIGPVTADVFKAVDFVPLIAYERQRRVVPLVKALDEAGFSSQSLDKTKYADLTATAASIVAALHIPDPTAAGLFQQPMRPRQRGYRMLDMKHAKIIHGTASTSMFHIAVVIDPLSETAQKWSSLLKWLSSFDSVYMEICLVADQTREELPLKRFYRSSLRDRLVFDDAGDEIPAMVRFDGLPEEPIYTLAMDVPSSWLVRPRESKHDLDNIHLASLSPSERAAGVKALFDLDFLVIEGHARETSAQGAVRGLQLQLVNHEFIPMADTLVVENLGYFQFKAKPGVFQLEIMKGHGEDIFVTESVGNAGWDSPPVNSEAGGQVTLTSFEGLTLYPRFRRHQGQADSDVLRPRREGFISSAVQKVVSAVSTWIQPPSTVKQADINIFTVASGHLYERFASIMVSSVMKNTNSTVKFWFIENFLSPAFLEFIPHLAEELNFEYELVTYKWPSWLRSQREKQRVIWGYKILFLDVLFPMDLKKVIFVDADQIVRADLKELIDLDLHGAPYGYTPMGDDNTDMEGFRFWKTGYWKDFLRGRPYHISALYVIDLVKFRQLAAGDRLRGHYQQLSADPNSLANLDQDLPNNMQSEVPIFSLDKDWLWCETWCSKDRLDKAKTIDLCQNPLTKEPKLSRARQIPEWSQYDAEIARFARQLVKDGKIGSSALGAEVDALAGEKPSTSAEGLTVEGEPVVAEAPVPSPHDEL